MRPGRVILVLAAAAGWGSVLTAQQVRDTVLTRALDLEQREDYGGAARAYRAVLAGTPGSAAALLGLERVLTPLGQAASVLPEARRAVAAAPGPAAWSVLLRAFMNAGERDSARSVAERWGREAPGDDTPWRTWAQAALLQHDRATARTALREGRARLGRPDALAPEMAELAVAEGDWPAAAREWSQAVAALPGYAIRAAALLANAPLPARPEVLRALEGDSSAAGAQVAATLLARWGDPVAGYRTLAARAPPGAGLGYQMLSQYADLLRASGAPAALRALGLTLEAMAQRTGRAAAARLLVEAAQAYGAGGDRAGAARSLRSAAAADSSVTRTAVTPLVEALIADGKMAEATSRTEAARGSLTADQYQALRHLLAGGWLSAGRLATADSLLSGDSTVEGLALAARVALYRGALRRAVSLFRAAGPFAGTREEATGRAALLALLQPIRADSLPALGDALFQLARGDSGGAVTALAGAAGALPDGGGGAEVRLLAGRVAAAHGDTAGAEQLFRAADTPAAPVTAPAAELELAGLLAARGRADEARATLERLILTYGGSALVPQARRMLDQLRGATPPS